MTNIYQGSLDPFQDIAEKLDKMGVHYCLMVGMADSSVTSTWCNSAEWGPKAVHNLELAMQTEVTKQEGLLP